MSKLSQTPTWQLPIGATPDATGTRFRVWAADARQVAVVFVANGIIKETYSLQAEGDGYFSAHIAGVGPGTYYMYRVDNNDPRPDPASRLQPEGVHGVSCVVDPTFTWTAQDWGGIALNDLVVYELHVGTATPEGTFDALIARLNDLRELGITAIELMPVADFPGNRNWGYDGVDLFAPARAYGGPDGLKRLVDAAHARGLAVLLDVVYNHLGPDGNYLRLFSHAYFTDRHQTPWGDALNMDGADSRPVRDFFIHNACYWAHEYQIDGLRLDATHAIVDDSPTHILAELATTLRESLPPERQFLIIAENEHNDAAIVRPPSAGGWGLDGVWADDFHHQVRVAVAGDNEGYYIDYSGSATDLATTIQQGWFYTGQLSQYADEPRGTPTDGLDLAHFIFCIQNHDQVGNRAFGERLNHQIELNAYRAVSVLLLCSPATPLLFMGQEWAASSPFLYFTDHNPELGKLVTTGRRAEFARFSAFAGTEVPDPQARETYDQSKLRWDERGVQPYANILQLYRDLLLLRRTRPALHNAAREQCEAVALDDDTLALRRTTNNPAETILVVVHLGKDNGEVDLTAYELTRPPVQTGWQLLLDSETAAYGGVHTADTTAAATPMTRLRFDGPQAVVLASA